MKWRQRRKQRHRILRRPCQKSPAGLRELLCCPDLYFAAQAASAVVKCDKAKSDLVEILIGLTWSRAVFRFDEDPASCRKIFDAVRTVASRARRVGGEAVEAAIEASSFAPATSAAVLNARFERHENDHGETLEIFGWPSNAPAHWKIRDVDRAWLNHLVDEPTARPALRACAAIGPPAVPEFLEARGLCLRDLLDDDLESVHLSCFYEDEESSDDDDDDREYQVFEDEEEEEEVYAGLSWDSMPHYLKYPYEDGTGAEGDCCICLQSLVDPAVRHRLGKPARLECACSKFLFHELCLRQHLATKIACPVCRAVPVQVKPSRAPLVW